MAGKINHAYTYSRSSTGAHVKVADWSEDMKDQLRAFWSEDIPVREIGRRMNLTKNAIVGKSHRLDLPARPSPIKRNADGTPYVTKRARKSLQAPTQTLPPPLASAEPMSDLAVVCEPAIRHVKSMSMSIANEPPVQIDALAAHDIARQRPVITARPPKPVPAPKPIAEPPPPKYGRVIECQTIVNQGRFGIGLEFCPNRAEPGRSYCEACCARYYIGAPKPRLSPSVLGTHREYVPRDHAPRPQFEGGLDAIE